MGYSHDKGYRAEAQVERLFQELHEDAYRPRAGTHFDVGDIAGVPLVVSVKDHVKLDLSGWTDDLVAMMARANLPGVVWHKRRRKANPRDWYVTTTGGTFFEDFYKPYLLRVTRGV